MAVTDGVVVGMTSSAVRLDRWGIVTPSGG